MPPEGKCAVPVLEKRKACQHKAKEPMSNIAMSPVSKSDVAKDCLSCAASINLVTLDFRISNLALKGSRILLCLWKTISFNVDCSSLD